MTRPPFSEALRFWLKLGFISFGGPTGQIAIMHSELVEKKRWIDESRFLHALNYCMLLPGPEATQLAIYCGWLLHGTPGGIVAGLLFFLPAAVLLWGLSLAYVTYGQTALLAGALSGLKPAVIAIVIAAAYRIGRRALQTRLAWAVATSAFVAIFFFHAAFPLIILSAAIIGLFFFKGGTAGHGNTDAGGGAALESAVEFHPEALRRPSLARLLKVCALWIPLWVAPTVLAAIFLSHSATLTQQGIFFSKAAMVTFGGAYAVLPYVAQQAVEQQGWLSVTQMTDGLGLAETTPGPLIIVLEFVGFLGGWNRPGQFSPLTAATLGAAITVWATFVPCFLWVLAGAPYVERMREHRRLNGALSAITAAVVGVVFNLAVWFALRVWSSGTPGVDWWVHVDWRSIAISVGALVAMVRLKVDIVPVVLAAALLGLLLK